MTFKAKSNPAEGPNPAGVATRLRRERDEARRRRDDLEITVKELRARTDANWRAVCAFANALQALPKLEIADGKITLPLNAVVPLVLHYTDATGDFEDLEPLLPEEPAEVE